MINRNNVDQWITNYNSQNHLNPVKTLDELAEDVKKSSMAAIVSFTNPYKDVEEGFEKLKLFGEGLQANVKRSLYKFINESNNNKQKFQEIIDETIIALNKVNLEVNNDEEESKTIIKQTLFKRLYVGSDGQAQFNLTDEKKYLAHALLQTALYMEQQECGISKETTNCINDGTNAYPISVESFDRMGKNEFVFNDNHYQANTRLKNNPGTREEIKSETFYFYNCHIEANKYNNTNTNGRFGYDFDAYNAQYAKAQSILCGLEEMDADLPEEIQDAVSNVNIQVDEDYIFNHVTAYIKNVQSAEEIHECLTKISKLEKPLGRLIKGIIDCKEYKEKYEDTKEGILTNLKNFVIKCFLAIYEFAKWWFTVDLIDEAKDNWRDNCKEATENEAIVDFRTHVTTNLGEQRLL